MLVNSVIIVLREVLEAALLISVLLAASHGLRLRRRWLVGALAVGLIGAVAYALSLARVTEMFDGVGQELVNAGMQFCVFASLVVIVFHVSRYLEGGSATGRILPVCMGVAVALAAAQEGSEIIIYVSGFWRMDEFLSSVGIGSVAGAAIGFSIGVLLYYGLLAMRTQRAMWAAMTLLGLAAANMCIQATSLLIQADWLTASRALWDTSAWIHEGSLPGELLYALVGYEATPSPAEVGMYLAALIAVGTAIGLGRLVAPAGDRVQP